MGQKSKDAAVKDAQIESSKEEYVLGMGQNSNDAALMDAQINLRREECALGTGQHGQRNDAAVMDAQIKSSKKEYVGDMEQTATPTMNLQLLHHTLGQNLTKLQQRILISVIQEPCRTKAACLRR